MEDRRSPELKYKQALEERVDQREQQLLEKEERRKVQEKSFEVIKMLGKTGGYGIDKQAILKDKLQGRFQLCINRSIPMRQKITKFAADPHSFLLHKRRAFVE